MIVNVGDVQLGVDDEGSGLPVVFLHGFPHDRSLWAQQRRALSSHVRCITPDLRGFGESTFAGPVSMDVYADDIAALLDVLDIDKAVICGLSMGGYIAMAMWRRHAARARVQPARDRPAAVRAAGAPDHDADPPRHSRCGGGQPRAGARRRAAHDGGRGQCGVAACRCVRPRPASP